ncbi:hypothetical protein CANARDRAFT_200138 [[Candida] arabinofermentans NRRL YB-2248]|uniref:VPS4-associated protein 1 n=1 Tax=[Candida] arabinofermentans NRRL YB-2248 TaxID=983967 RepID=A0A1E4SYX5_9ASCO|nr:hypothetical protein CANARDRAFT_200138 [[Candida] arabinofermentans NRRL YB-2248]
MTEVPFKNCYSLKKVNEKDSKSCNICFKLTNSVLISLNSKDWFYICDVHLLDKNFCTLLYIESTTNNGATLINKQNEYNELKLKESNIVKKIKHYENLIDVKNSQLNKFKEYIWSSKKKSDDKEDTKEDENSNLKDTELNIDQLNDKLKTLKNTELINIKSDIIKFEKTYRKYQLVNVFYKNRITLYYKKLKKVEIERATNDGSLFPSLDNLPQL